MTIRLTMLLCGFALLTGCAEEPKPRTVTEFLDNPIVLEAAMVRCGQNRDQSRYDAECINARQAASIIAAKEERIRQEVFDAESNKKREALRRTQLAAAEARRRAEEAARLREEAEYLAQFGEPPPGPTTEGSLGPAATNAPGMVVPEAEAQDQTLRRPEETQPASDGGNAPSVVPDSTPSTDLDAVREELRKRAEESGN